MFPSPASDQSQEVYGSVYTPIHLSVYPVCLVCPSVICLSILNTVIHTDSSNPSATPLGSLQCLPFHTALHSFSNSENAAPIVLLDLLPRSFLCVPSPLALLACCCTAQPSRSGSNPCGLLPSHCPGSSPCTMLSLIVSPLKVGSSSLLHGTLGSLWISDT